MRHEVWRGFCGGGVVCVCVKHDYFRVYVVNGVMLPMIQFLEQRQREVKLRFLYHLGERQEPRSTHK